MTAYIKFILLHNDLFGQLTLSGMRMSMVEKAKDKLLAEQGGLAIPGRSI
jgi:hypothetical protein